MEDLMKQEAAAAAGGYQELKNELKTELQKTAEGFVRIGYLLKVARDTNVLQDSGYATVAEFAKAEYGLEKDAVSRFIAINDRFSEDGSSDHLADRYQGYGYAKLTEMLTLPQEIIDSLSPDLPRRALQEVKQEIAQEQKISDLEVMMEGQKYEQHELSPLGKVLHQYFYDNREDFVTLAAGLKEADSLKEQVAQVLDVLAPSGSGVKTVRVQGVGRYLLSFRGEDKTVALVNVRDAIGAQEYTWESVMECLTDEYLCGMSGKAGWEQIYHEPFGQPAAGSARPDERDDPKKGKVAPVQQPGNAGSTQSDGIPDVVNMGTASLKDILTGLPKPTQAEIDEAMEKYPQVSAAPRQQDKESAAQPQQEEQLPGQMEVSDYPGVVPDNAGKDQNAAAGFMNTPVEPEENPGDRVNTLSEGLLDDEKKIAGFKSSVTALMMSLNQRIISEDWGKAAQDADRIASNCRSIMRAYINMDAEETEEEE